MPEKNKKIDPKEMPFLDHLEELRRRILISLGVTMAFMIAFMPLSGFFLDILTLPNNRLKEPAQLIYLKPAGIMMVRMEIGLVAGLIAALPVIFYQLWKFISPGLTPKERKMVMPAIMITTLCFLIGSAFCYFIIIPTILPFLYSMSTETIRPQINISEYIGFLLRMILVSGLIFELPVLSYFLSRVGILKPEFMKKYRRYAIVVIFVFAAIVTPPDPVSQSLMAVPLTVLYEISIWISVIAVKKRQQAEAETDNA
ncbi:twin-arginine translocase subunit TatC [bacterium]|nr:twin-arginine translocase subunit TatC [bacterium]